MKVVFQFVMKAKVFLNNLTRLINVYETTIKIVNNADREHISTQFPLYIFEDVLKHHCKTFLCDKD